MINSRMNYKKHYATLIERARHRVLEEYTEKHHVIPRCLGGSDDKENIVVLTPEEHHVAHQLLVKMYPKEHKLVYAANMMTVSAGNLPRNNKRYGWLKKKYISVCRARTGSKNSSYGKSWYYNPDIKETGKFLKENVPTDWIKGRILDFDAVAEKKRNAEEEKAEKQRHKKQVLTDEAQQWYEKFNKSKTSSIREFVRESDYDKSHVSFIKMLKKYVTEFEPKSGTRFIPR